jgi:hypothetical protein
VYLDSLAAVNYAEAYKRTIENSVSLTKAYYERREIREEYMQKYGPKPLSAEARKKFIEYYQPKRLSAQEFDPAFAKLTWPHILRQDQFAPLKTQIDSMFASRDSTNTGDGSKTHREISQLCSNLTSLLREHISSMTSDQYINALEFIRSVELEARNVLPADFKFERAPAPVVEEPAVEKIETERAADVIPVSKKETDTTSLKRVTTRTKA